MSPCPLHPPTTLLVLLRQLTSSPPHHLATSPLYYLTTTPDTREYYYWEVIESYRRVIFVGAIALFETTTQRAAAGVLLAWANCQLYGFSPYKVHFANVDPTTPRPRDPTTPRPHDPTAPRPHARPHDPTSEPPRLRRPTSWRSYSATRSLLLIALPSCLTRARPTTCLRWR